MPLLAGLLEHRVHAVLAPAALMYVPAVDAQLTHWFGSIPEADFL